MSDLVKLALEEDLIAISRIIGNTTDLDDLDRLRAHYITANALWARIGRLTIDPPSAA